MASIVDIAPSLGHGVVTAQGGAATGYDAIDDRRFWGVGKQEGVLPTPGAWKVTPGATGLTVTVAADIDGALVQGDAVAAQGLYYVAPHAAPITLDLAPADPTNPRNDLVVVEVRDDAHDALGTTSARVRVVTGTPTAGATEADAFGVNGTPALPDSAFCVAVVNVRANAATILATDLLDRRPWALGASRVIVRNSGDYTNTNSGSFIDLDATNLAPRLELVGGRPVVVTLEGWIDSLDVPSGRAAGFALNLNGSAAQSDLGEVGVLSNGDNYKLNLGWVVVPAVSGSYVVKPTWRLRGGTSVTLKATAALPLTLTIRQRPIPADNSNG